MPTIKHREARDGQQTPEYRSWVHMIGRCYNTKNDAYMNYGGRGVMVCPEWRESYSAFLSYMGRRPSLSYNLDRFPDNDGNYEPGNCRWATWKEQHRNKRSNKRVLHQGLDLTIAEWAERLRMTPSMLGKRLKSGRWSVEQAFTLTTGRIKKS